MLQIIILQFPVLELNVLQVVIYQSWVLLTRELSNVVMLYINHVVYGSLALANICICNYTLIFRKNTNKRGVHVTVKSSTVSDRKESVQSREPRSLVHSLR